MILDADHLGNVRADTLTKQFVMINEDLIGETVLLGASLETSEPVTVHLPSEGSEFLDTWEEHLHDVLLE